MNASACSRASASGARSGCIRLAASRNRRFSDAGGTGCGGGESALASDVLSRARVRASRAPSRSPLSARIFASTSCSCASTVTTSRV